MAVEMHLHRFGAEKKYLKIVDEMRDEISRSEEFEDFAMQRGYVFYAA